MRRREYQSGFSTIVILLVVVVVAVLAVAGFVVYRHHKSNNTKSSATTSQTQNTTNQQSKTATSPSPTPPTQNTTNFAIPEIHAKIQLPDGLTSSDLKYSVSTNIGVPVANFTTTTLENTVGGSDCTAENGAIGAIWRTTQAPPSSSPVVKQIGQYYYYLQEPQQPCSANQSAEQLETAQIAELKKAFETITATN